MIRRHHRGMIFMLGIALLVAALPPASAYSQQTEEKLMEAIREHRMATLTVLAPAGAEVRIEQVRHDFEFGTAISHRPFLPERASEPDFVRYREILEKYFNAAVHENALKWYHTERERGQINYDDAERLLQWCQDRGMFVRGHCIFWEVEKYVQPWIQQLPDDALRAEIKRRALEVTTRFKGRISEYDLNNEMIHGSYYTGRLGQRIIDDMFAWAKEGDPAAILYVNDYSILHGPDFDKYVAHIESLLARGVPVGGIGCQEHLSGPVNWPQFERRLDRLAEFGLPIKITEYDQEKVDDAQRAADLRRLLMTCFAHPRVEGFYMWGFWEGAHWRPGTAIWKKDWTPTPAAKVYEDLVFNEWWTRESGQADASGRFTTRAYHGRHRVTVNGKPHDVHLPRTAASHTLDAR
jgi:endo-1,4-beta-xylanase